MSTVLSVSIELSRRLADQVSAGNSDGERFSANERLQALDAAYNQVVIGVLGYTRQQRSAYQLLGELTQREQTAIVAGGNSLNNFNYGVAAGGVIGVECNINGKEVWAVERDVDDLQWSSNQWFQGNDLRPVYYIQSNLLKVEVTLGSYPFTAYVHYIRQPRKLNYNATNSIYTASLETNPLLDEIIVSGAVAVAQQMSDDQDKVALMTEATSALIQSMVSHELGKGNKRPKGDA